MSNGEAGGIEREVAREVVLHPVRRTDGRARVLLSVGGPDRGLTRALLQHLSAELAGLSFTLDEGAEVDAIWSCGFDATGPDRVRALRGRHPEAVLLVTRRGRADGWESVALASGADEALVWPVDYSRLSRILGGSAQPTRSAPACS